MLPHAALDTFSRNFARGFFGHLCARDHAEETEAEVATGCSMLPEGEMSTSGSSSAAEAPPLSAAEALVEPFLAPLVEVPRADITNSDDEEGVDDDDDDGVASCCGGGSRPDPNCCSSQ